MTIRPLLYGWIFYLALAWLTSIGIFYSDIAIHNDLHRFLPVIERAEAYFVENNELPFLKKTAWIYEKDLALFVMMLLWGGICSRYFLKVNFVGVLEFARYKENALGIIMVLACVFAILSNIFGPGYEDSTRGLFSNKLYLFSTIFGAFNYTVTLPLLFPLIAFGISGFFSPIDKSGHKCINLNNK
ncbi:hypothetical protein [Pseudomonas helleri]|uniref:hypothetical protein n=1 Tax=Pseudomonas helleri TaxID=1608996 RepID=UPI003D0DBAE4